MCMWGAIFPEFPMANEPLQAVLQQIRRMANEKAFKDASDGDLVKRFLVHREEAAFVVLLKRHGPMVLQVCKRIQANEHDAEDAFQATFLLLARKANTIRKRESVASWLYGVAHRLAIGMKGSGLRRQQRERQAADMRAKTPVSNEASVDLEATLDKALRQVPEKYRAPLLLCYLEGKTQEEAAKHLGCPLGTVRSRLARGRDRLREVLERHGVRLSTTALTAALAATSASAAIRPTLVRATAKAALEYAAGKAAAALVSAQAAALVERGLRTMMIMKLATTTAVAVMMVGTLGLGAGAFAVYGSAGPYQAISQAPPSESLSTSLTRQVIAATQAPKQQPKDDKDSIAYRGQVLGPNGKPVSGAKLYVTPANGGWGYRIQPSAPEFATTGADGRFQFTVPITKDREQYATTVAAMAPQFGIGWVEVVGKDAKRDDLRIQLVDDDVPIIGQILNLEGKPVPDATLHVLQVNAAPGEDLAPWLDAVKGKKAQRLDLEGKYFPRYTFALAPAMTTDQEGRFRLTGVGRNRLVTARIDGSTIESQYLRILTRQGEAITVPENWGEPGDADSHSITTYYGATFRHVAAPTRPIIGVVRDKDTKKPLAGFTVRSYARETGPALSTLIDIVRTTTDADGRYRLLGLPKGKGYSILVVPPKEQPEVPVDTSTISATLMPKQPKHQPYVPVHAEVPDAPGLDPVTVDFALKRGVWIEGKITDKGTGKPLKAHVEYFALYTNPHIHEYQGYADTVLLFGNGSGASEDGSYRVPGLPGPGLLVVWRLENYLLGQERDDEFMVNEKPPVTAPYQLLPLGNYGAFARIDPAKGVESAMLDVTMDPGWTFTGTVVGPDGRPLPDGGVGLTGWGWRKKEGTNTAEFTVWSFNPRRPRDLLFQHLEKGLIGVAQPPNQNGGSVTVRMEPGASVTGRLIDASGEPRAGIDLQVQFRQRNYVYTTERIKTDPAGRFQIGALLPGQDFRLSDGQAELPLSRELRAGQTKNLGDVQLKRSND
jgi:RNA polymerase sigma factor (sigma-70 family)